MKSIGRSITGYKLNDNEAHIKSVLYNLTCEIIHKARKMDLSGRQVWIGLSGGEKGYWSDHLTLNYYINHVDDMFSLVYHRLYRSWHRQFPIIKFALRLSLLRPTNQTTPSLLPKSQKQEKIHQSLDKISARYGLFSVHSGLLQGHQIIYPEVTGFLGDKDYQLNYT